MPYYPRHNQFASLEFAKTVFGGGMMPGNTVASKVSWNGNPASAVAFESLPWVNTPTVTLGPRQSYAIFYQDQSYRWMLELRNYGSNTGSWTFTGTSGYVFGISPTWTQLYIHTGAVISATDANSLTFALTGGTNQTAYIPIGNNMIKMK